MKIEQLYTKCLSQSSYFIESAGEAAIIDPIRESDPYIEMAEQHGAKIKYIFETHFHADFVSGHIDLAKKTGATIVYGPGAGTEYQALIGEDLQTFELGDVSIQLLHTPGHTPESSSFLLKDASDKDHCVFTGDTLFVGDVGRPDLAVKSDLTTDDLGGLLYDSLRKKIMPLADDVIVYPGHGQGSSCGKNLGSETWSTIGQQKLLNYALQDMSREEFVAQVTEGLAEPPKYFFEDARINKVGYETLEEVMEVNLRPLSVEELVDQQQKGVLILDTRSPRAFEKGHIEGSINIGLGGQYAIWVGTLINIDTPMIVVAEPGKEEESILRLARVGYEKVLGFLDGGITSWTSSLSTLETISPENFATLNNVNVLDVRKVSEYSQGHMAEAQHYSLQDLEDHLSELDEDKMYYVHCKSGYRSTIACSILKHKGYKNVINIHGGFDALKTLNVTIQ